MPIRTRPEADLAATRSSLELPERFLFYPGQTWPHKNHEGLLEALALIRERHGETPPLVCSGHRNELQPKLERRAEELGLQDAVRFVGFVEPLRLRCLYQLATAVLFPSRFEGWGMPVTEAFSLGVPVACSNTTSLPEVAGDAALLFDPESAEEMAEAAWSLWTDARAPSGPDRPWQAAGSRTQLRPCGENLPRPLPADRWAPAFGRGPGADRWPGRRRPIGAPSVRSPAA